MKVWTKPSSAPRQPRVRLLSRRQVARRLTVVLVAGAALAAPLRVVMADPTPAAIDAAGATTARNAAAAACRCDDFDAEVAATQAIFAARGEGAATPTTAAMLARYRQAVDETYERASCLVRCQTVSDRDRNRARVLLGNAGFRSGTAGSSKAIVQERLNTVVMETERCLAAEPEHPACHLLHATARGLLIRDSWNPLNVTAPRAILAEFRAARGGKPPGEDLYDGAAMRGEVLFMLRAPSVVGGDIEGARRLVEQAARSLRFACVVSNGVIVAEAAARGGDYERAKKELAATIADGLPSCGEPRYENASSLEVAKRCLAKLEQRAGVDPGWDEDCR